mmetsp:Transcript_28520/g.62747  ORF Transcript_28520/g.62747 Transcript_28520/m.62747 type:complete len:290 (-) Transcript_28520:124-993(-)
MVPRAAPEPEAVLITQAIRCSRNLLGRIRSSRSSNSLRNIRRLYPVRSSRSSSRRFKVRARARGSSPCTTTTLSTVAVSMARRHRTTSTLIRRISSSRAVLRQLLQIKALLPALLRRKHILILRPCRMRPSSGTSRHIPRTGAVLRPTSSSSIRGMRPPITGRRRLSTIPIRRLSSSGRNSIRGISSTVTSLLHRTHRIQYMRSSSSSISISSINIGSIRLPRPHQPRFLPPLRRTRSSPYTFPSTPSPPSLLCLRCRCRALRPRRRRPLLRRPPPARRRRCSSCRRTR